MKQLIGISALLVFFAGVAMSQTKWEVPAKNHTMKAAADLKNASVVATGKDLWAKHCKSCHGAKGLGDGPKAAMLKTNPGNFTTPAFQGKTDGDLYYKTLTGRNEMPAFDKKIPNPADQWSLVAFMRTLKP